MSTFDKWVGGGSHKTPGVTGLAWQYDAACVNEPLDTFFPTTAAEEAATKGRVAELCGPCPVRAQCLDYSLAMPEKYGYWGGLGEEERAEERRYRMRRGDLAAPKPKKTGRSTVKRPSGPRSKLPRVDATGTRRRLQALAVVGHGSPHIARRIGDIVHSSYLSVIRSGRVPTTRVDVAEAVTAVYPQLITEKPVVNSHGVAATAVERGWVGPEVWVGVDIDDPNARPRALERSAA